MVVTAPGKYSFHPKVWLIAREDRAVLLCGSGNLTQSGFVDNPELFDVVKLSKEEDSDELSAIDRGQ
jgi:HKD family nuclease